MNRCTVIDLLEDKYGLNKGELSKRELAIIGLCTNELADDEEQELNLHLVSQRSELLIRFGFYVTNGNYKKLCNDVRATVKNFEADI